MKIIKAVCYGFFLMFTLLLTILPRKNPCWAIIDDSGVMAADDIMYLTPADVSFTTDTANTGTKFNITVWLNMSTPIESWQYYLLYNKNQLRALRASYTNNGKSIWSGDLPTSPMWPVFKSENDTYDGVLCGEALAYAATKNGSGSLSWVEFEIIQGPSSGQNLSSELRLDLIGPVTGFSSLVLDVDFRSMPLTFGNAAFTFSQGAPFGKRTPVARFTYTPDVPFVGSAATFDASSSYDLDRDIASYLWNFKDGNISSTSASTIDHVYVSHGTYNVTLTVIDSGGRNSSFSNTVLVKMPTFVSISTSCSSTFVGFEVNITGRLSDLYGNALRNEKVVLHYTFNESSTWTAITSGTTDSLGNYHAMWIPTATGYFTLRAEWAGNATHLEARKTAMLSSMPYNGQYIFSVESNSTISNLAFNTTDWLLSFTATGPNGTRGYVIVTFAKSLVTDPANIRVYLDGSQTGFKITSMNNSWLLYFDYSHSTHQVAVDLDVNKVPEFPLLPVVSILVIVSLVAATLRKEKRRLKK